MTAKEKLLLWSQRMVEGYQGLRCDNFTSSWRDGRLFNAIIHRHKYVARGAPGHLSWATASKLGQGQWWEGHLLRWEPAARGAVCLCQPGPLEGCRQARPPHGPPLPGAFLRLHWLP